MPNADTVLVVDDEPSVRELLQQILEDEGYIVDLASNGEEALKQINSKRPSVVILDLMMPVMDGWQFLEEVQKLPDFKKLPIILLSASRNLLQTGRNNTQMIKGWLAKPFDILEVLQLIEKWL